MILCDIDMVLATSGGHDTAAGQPIHRTFTQSPSQLEMIREANLSFHVVTAKTEVEAWDILTAIGLHSYVTSVIGANVLFWPSLWRALKQGRIPERVSKAFYTRSIARPAKGAVAKRVVMIEDRKSNLFDMFEAGCIDVGVLVPPIRVEGECVVEWFDLDAALGMARDLALNHVGVADLSRQGLTVYRWKAGGLEPVDAQHPDGALGADRYLVELPPLSAAQMQSPGVPLGSWDTGRTLTPRRGSTVALLRIGRRMLRRVSAVLSLNR